jgi:hypothetical protein
LVLPVSAFPKPIAYETPSRSENVKVEVVRQTRPVGVRVRLGLRRTGRASGRLARSMIPPARWFSPVRLMIMAMCLIVAGTVWLTVYWSRRGTLGSELVNLRAGWSRDIEAGDFVQARIKLEQAAAAIKKFHGSTRDERETRQLANEVAAITDLVDRPLDEVLRERQNMSDSEAEQYFREKLKNPTILLDSFVVAAHGGDSSGGKLRVDNPMVLGPEAVRLDIGNLECFETFAAPVPTRVLFAARIQTIERVPKTTGWTLRFMPHSGVVMTSKECLEKLGWPMDSSIQQLLDSQAKWVLERP